MLLLLLLAACRPATEDTPDKSLTPANDSEPVGQQAPIEVTSFAGVAPAGALARLGRGSLDVAVFSPDDEHIAVGGEVGLYLYKADTLEEVWQLPATSPILSLAFSPDGAWLAAGSVNSVVNLIHAPTGKVVQGTPPSNGEQNGVNALAWSKEREPAAGQILAVGFNDGSVAISRIGSTGDEQTAESPPVEVLGILDRSPGGVTALAFSPNGRILVTGDRTGQINLWEVATLTWFGRLEGDAAGQSLLDLVWSPEGDQLLSGDREGKVILWDILTFEPLHQIDVPAAALQLDFAPDGQSFAVADAAGKVVFHQRSDPYQEELAISLGSELAGLAFPSSWDNFAAFTPAGQLSLWPLTGGSPTEPTISLNGHTSSSAAANAQAWSPDGEIVATGLDDRVILWDAATWSPIQILEGHESGITALAWSPDGAELASASRDHTVFIWDLASGEPRLHLTEHSRNVTDLAYSPDGRRLATAGSLDNTVLTWDMESGQVLGIYPGEGAGAWSVAWSPDGQTLATGLTSGRVHLWKADNHATPGPLSVMIRHSDWVSGLDFSADGSLLASAGADGRLLITRLEDEKARTYVGHLGAVRRARFNPDGASLVTAGFDGKVIIWDAGQEAITEPLAILDGHTDSINDAGWSPDGRYVLSVSDDGTAIVWDSAPGP